MHAQPDFALADSRPSGWSAELRPEELVLVAILNRPRDLEIARALGWYRIPLGSAPKTVRVDWLAFYLPATFGSQRWSVRYLARVHGYELATRRELLASEVGHPRADEPYYKLQLGPLLELSRPISAGRWFRFSFLYTTGARLLAARTLRDLTVRRSEREQLWRLLRERARQPAWAR